MLQFANILMSLQGIFSPPQNSHLFEKRELMEYILAFFFSIVLHFIYFLKNFILYWGLAN